jgi:hypothetical protein
MFVLLVFRKNGITESCLFIEDLSAYKISSSDVDWYNFRIHLRSLKIPPSPYSKAPLKKMMIQMKLVGMLMIFHFTKLRLSKCNGSWVASIKQNVNFKFQPLAMFIFLVYRKSSIIKSCSSSEDLSSYNVSWSHADWWKLCIHLTSMNGHHFGRVEATWLTNMALTSSPVA